MSTPLWVDRMDQLAAQGVPYLFVLDFDLVKPIIVPLDELLKSGPDGNVPGIRFQIGALSSPNSNPSPIQFSKSPISFEEYQKGFNDALTAIKAGDTYLLNLCYSTKLSNLDSLADIFD